MIEFSIVNLFEQRYFKGMYFFVGNDDGTSIVDWEAVGHYAKFVQQLEGIIIMEDAV